jgi:hypothetical protein
MTALYGVTVSYDEFLPEVMQFCPDVPELVATNAIRNTCIDFCTRTYYWQITPAAIDVVNGQASYTIQTPPDTKLVGIMAAYYNTNLLIPQPIDTLANIYRMGDWQQVQGSPQYYTQIIKPEIRLVPYPYETVPGALTVRVAIAPTRDSSEISSEIYENFLGVIANGARSILYGTPGQPYFDRASAKDSDRIYRTGVSEARIAVNKGLTRTSNRAEFQRFV